MDDILKKNDENTELDKNSVLTKDTENPEDLDSMWLRWKCLNCGYVYEGVNELRKCPKCGNENPDLFTDVD